jgi:hypothetical protein
MAEIKKRLTQEEIAGILDKAEKEGSGADLSRAKNLLDAARWLGENFKSDKKGLIVYKAIGNTSFASPTEWKFEAGLFLEEVVNPLPTLDCTCGVNVATLAWCKSNHSDSTIWRCRINWIDLACAVVPYNTDGKFRAGRVELLEIVEGGQS